MSFRAPAPPPSPQPPSSNNYGQKLSEEINFLETGCFQPRAVPLRPADLTPLHKNYLYGVGMVLKVVSRSFHSNKSYSTFSEEQTDRQANRQTDRHTPSHPYRDGQIFHMPFLIPFTSLYSLPFVKDNYGTRYLA
jgi:hypothetical protein